MTSLIVLLLMGHLASADETPEFFDDRTSKYLNTYLEPSPSDPREAELVKKLNELEEYRRNPSSEEISAMGVEKAREATKNYQEFHKAKEDLFFVRFCRKFPDRCPGA